MIHIISPEERGKTLCGKSTAKLVALPTVAPTLAGRVLGDLQPNYTPVRVRDVDCASCRGRILCVKDVQPLGATQGMLFAATPEAVYPAEDRARGEKLRSARFHQGIGPETAAARLGLSGTVYAACERGEKAFELDLAETWLGSPL